MFIAWIVILALLQATVFKDLNLLLVLTILYGLRKGPGQGLLVGTVTGALVGIFSSGSFALNLILYATPGFIAGIISSHVYYQKNIFTDFLFSYCAVMLFYFASFAFRDISGSLIFSTAFCSAVFSPVLFRLVER